MVASIVSFLFIQFSFAHDWGSLEGKFYCENNFCYADKSDCIKESKCESSCYGDAWGDRRTVFKVPNRTSWKCEFGYCEGGLIDELMLIGAKIKNGHDRYGAMKFDDFIRVMGNKELCDD